MNTSSFISSRTVFGSSRPTHLAWRRSLAITAAGVSLMAGHEAFGAIASGVGTGSITTSPPLTVEASGPIPMAPGDLFFTGSGGPFSALMALNWTFANTGPATATFDVNLNHHGAAAPPSGEPFVTAAGGSFGAGVLEADFSVTFTLDAFGLAETLLPKIEYPVEWFSGTAGVVTFDATIHYDDDFGHLGDRTLHFAPPAGSSGFVDVIGGTSFDELPLIGGDHLTLSGSFIITADAGGGSGSLIKVFGVPEPSSASVLALGGGMLLLRRRRS